VGQLCGGATRQLKLDGGQAGRRNDADVLWFPGEELRGEVEQRKQSAVAAGSRAMARQAQEADRPQRFREQRAEPGDRRVGGEGHGHEHGQAGGAHLGHERIGVGIIVGQGNRAEDWLTQLTGQR
jgi:hypothetical protein